MARAIRANAFTNRKNAWLRIGNLKQKEWNHWDSEGTQRFSLGSIRWEIVNNEVKERIWDS